jgi:L-fuculose-phosphate aldolase
MDAFMKMETVEHFAQITLIVGQLGSAAPIGKDRLAALLDARMRYILNAA